MASSTSLARSPIAAQATPKKIENTTICRISLSTIGRTAESGKTCLTKPSSVMACASMPELTPLTTLWTPTPGSNRLTRIRPSASDTSDALTNHSIALPPTRPTAARIRHVADADDQRREHQRPDDHLDQAQEDRAAERDVAGEQLLGRRIGELVVDQPAHSDAQHHRDEDVSGHIGSTSSALHPFDRVLQLCCNSGRR